MTIPSSPSQLHPEIQVRTEDRGVRYILPIRQLGSARWAGLIPLAFGLFGVGFTLFWIAGATGILERGWHLDGIHIGRLLFGAFGIPFLFGTFVPIALGMWLILPNHCEILITDTHLRSIEYGGPFHWTFRRRLNAIKTLRVALRGFESDKKNPQPDMMAKWAAIKVEGDFKKTMILAPGYPREMLIPLAQDISQRCALSDPMAVMHLDPAQRHEPIAPTVDIEPLPETTATDEKTKREGIIPKPSASKIMLLQDAGMTTFMLPPQGYTKTLRGLLFFSIVWCGFISLFTYVMFFAGNAKFPSGILPAILAIAAFWAIGIGMFLLSFHFARRKAVLLLTPETLTFTQTGPLRKSEKQWTVADIADVRMDDSSTSVNDVPLKQLQICNKNGKKQGLLTGRDEAELKWIASVLRQTLSVP